LFLKDGTNIQRGFIFFLQVKTRPYTIEKLRRFSISEKKRKKDYFKVKMLSIEFIIPKNQRVFVHPNNDKRHVLIFI
jgi:hypothetical protein